MSNVVRLMPKRTPVATTSPQFDAAWAVFPESGRLRSSRKQAWPAWCAVCREIPEEDLVARVRRYAAEDKEHRKDHGAPGFHRWLAWGRWEHWAPVAQKLVIVAKFPDEEVRASYFARFSEHRARRWLDSCGWDAERREIFDAPPARSEWLQGPFSTWAKVAGVKGVTFKPVR